MNRDEARKRARELAKEYHAIGDLTGWFEKLYSSAGGDASKVPWADGEVHPLLASWLGESVEPRLGKRALVVGSGLGEDAEGLSRAGFDVTAFDISPSAVEWCERRYSNTRVDYQVADLFRPPSAWTGAFEFVFECYTLQALPTEGRAAGFPRIAEFVAPGGTLLVIERAREPHEAPGELPWPLTRAELDRFESLGLERVRFDDVWDREDPPVRRFRAEYRARERSGPGSA